MVSTSLYLKIHNMRFINVWVLVLNVFTLPASPQAQTLAVFEVRHYVVLPYYYYYYYYYVNKQSIN